ncbi:MAG: hypothetical protein U5N86_13670 [Planctomycetota bacterium]|nr:hypothetical protein [Planctomycetota bacterium]
MELHANDLISIRSHSSPAHNCASAAILWSFVATATLLLMLLGRKLPGQFGFPLDLETTFIVFGITCVAFFIYIPPIYLTPMKVGKKQSGIWEVMATMFVLVLITVPFLVLLRRVLPVSKLQLGALLTIATTCGLSSSFFYILFPRFHFSFFTAFALGFPFLYICILEIWATEPYYLAAISPFVTIYFISPQMLLTKVGYSWSNTALIFGLIAFVCMSYLILVARNRAPEEEFGG